MEETMSNYIGIRAKFQGNFVASMAIRIWEI